jgi:hypothetical protein
MQHKDNRGHIAPTGTATDTGLPMFTTPVVTDTIRELIYCHTSTAAQLCRVAGVPMSHQLRRGLHNTFLKDHPFVDIHAGVFFDVCHDLHFDVMPR